MTRCPRCYRRLPPGGECEQHGKPSGIRDVEVPERWPMPPPGWILETQVATGGTSRVFAARRVGTGPPRPAVIKIARWSDPDISERFAIEAEALGAVGAPWVPELYGHGVGASGPFLAMERLDGESVADWMSRAQDRGALAEILALLDRLAAALEVVHARGFIHRDIKPENLVIGGRGIRILDFGLARRIGGDRPSPTLDGAVIGTAFYLAPEQLKSGGPLDARADVYAYGAVAFEMITGRPPFVGERAAIQYGHALCKAPRVRDLRPVPLELDELVAACLAKAPDQRPASAAAVRAWLARAVQAAATLVGVPPGAGAEPAPADRGPVALVWIDGGDPVDVVRTIEGFQGIVVRRRGGALLAAFTGLQHEAPLAAAIAAARALVADRCRTVVHHARALVRRSAGGRTTVYGEGLERPDRWLPPVIAAEARPAASQAPAWGGAVLSAAAVAELAPGGTEPAPDVPGFFRVLDRVRAGR